MSDRITDSRLTRAYEERAAMLFGMFVSLLRGADKEQDPVAVAEELRQETFLRAWQFREQYNARREASVETWIHRIAVNVFLDHLRKRRVRGLGVHVELTTLLLGERVEHFPSFVAEPMQERAAIYQDFVRRVERILAGGNLPSYCHTAFLLHALEDFRLSEIEDLTGINENRLKVGLWRTRLLLRKGLAREQ